MTKKQMRPMAVNGGQRKEKAPSHRLRELASEIRSMERNSAADEVALGRLLRQVKGLVKHGQFAAWLRFTVPAITPRVAQRAMQAAVRITLPAEQLRQCVPSTVRILAKRRVAKSAELTERALTGYTNACGKIGYRAMQSAISTVDPGAVHDIEAAAESEVEALGRQIMGIANDKNVDSLFVVFEREAEELPQVAITVLGDAGRKSVNRETVAGAFAAVTGEEATKRCNACRRELLPSRFSKESHYCKRCERIRVGEYTKAKRAANRAVKQRIGEMGS